CWMTTGSMRSCPGPYGGNVGTVISSFFYSARTPGSGLRPDGRLATTRVYRCRSADAEKDRHFTARDLSGTELSHVGSGDRVAVDLPFHPRCPLLEPGVAHGVLRVGGE